MNNLYPGLDCNAGCIAMSGELNLTHSPNSIAQQTLGYE